MITNTTDIKRQLAYFHASKRKPRGPKAPSRFTARTKVRQSAAKQKRGDKKIFVTSTDCFPWRW